MKALILLGVLLISGAATYLIRLSFIALEGRMNLPLWFRSALPYVPAAMLMALIAPDLLVRGGALAVSVDNPRLVAGIVAIVIARVTRSAMWTIVVGMAVLLIQMKAMA
ncbi:MULTISPECIES: AzlD domain-containing protein [Ralstonia solanacearum species complex]|uniref:Branched-chain amino acid transporter n=1 Tax=Ralstonia solanacearum TaxID=305 RepID=A0AAD0WGX9_RALSL|nr:AzlD domain-containing protein [Ralstonia solanacearum]BEU73136.1 AzlD domain-containing protein [Ralstonia pseudosolanacearum]AMP38544.1 branched-chain amino acid transporter [Ralstonia solanacearum]AXV77944.1 branched-chain amino acid transporter [Ralstonia solanacearum]AXV82565.1 branched-chain amino acid transporter [Ralstonia solanacearum]AXV87371.1 branched-chain amino acid transporter [Ralstonia solanacearum]